MKFEVYWQRNLDKYILNFVQTEYDDDGSIKVRSTSSHRFDKLKHLKEAVKVLEVFSEGFATYKDKI